MGSVVVRGTGLLLLVGMMVLSITVSDSYAQENRVNLINFVNTPPTANPIIVEHNYRQSGLIFVPISDGIRDLETPYEDLSIEFVTVLENGRDPGVLTFSLGTSESTGFEVIEDTDPIRYNVTADTLGIPHIIGASANFNFTHQLNYTVTDGDGLSSSNLITINLIVPAPPPGNRFLHPPMNVTYTLEQGDTLTQSIVHSGSTDSFSFILQYTRNFGSRANIFATLDSFTVATPGSQGGDITFTLDARGRSGTISYTPPSDDFVGVEVFEYNAQANHRGSVRIGNAYFIFNVTEIMCSVEVDSGVSFGGVAIGTASDPSEITITNLGSQAASTTISGKNWKSVENSALKVMNVGQTRYSLNDDGNYTAGIELTKQATVVGDEIPSGGDPLSIYLQLFIDLLRDNFRGDASQIMTISSACN